MVAPEEHPVGSYGKAPFVNESLRSEAAALIGAQTDTEKPATLEEARLQAELAVHDAALKQNPGDLSTMMKRGNVLAHLGRRDEALEAFSQIVSVATGHVKAEAHFQRALIRGEKGDWRGAIDDYEGFISVRSEEAFPYGRIATVYAFGPADIRDPQRALAQADKAIQQRDAHAGFHTLRGVCLYRLGRYREAAEVLEFASRGDGRKSDMNRFFAAMTYHQLGEADKAKQYYAEALTMPQTSRKFGTIDLVNIMRAEAEAVFNTSNEE